LGLKFGDAQTLSVGAAVPVFGQCQRGDGPLGDVSEGLASGLIFVKVPIDFGPTYPRLKFSNII
jgi:hypothetical protein